MHTNRTYSSFKHIFTRHHYTLGTILGAEDKEKKTDSFPALTYPTFSQERHINTIEYNMGSMFLWDVRESFPRKRFLSWHLKDKDDLTGQVWRWRRGARQEAHMCEDPEATDSREPERNQEASGVTVAPSCVGGAGGEAGGTSRRWVKENLGSHVMF